MDIPLKTPGLIPIQSDSSSQYVVSTNGGGGGGGGGGRDGKVPSST